MNLNEGPAFQRVILDRIRHEVSVEIPPYEAREMRLEQITDFMTGSLLYHLSFFTAGNVRETVDKSIQVPLTWWDAVKERWFTWIPWVKVQRRTIPVKIRVERICPHLDPKSNSRDHIEWLLAGRIDDYDLRPDRAVQKQHGVRDKSPHPHPHRKR